MFNKNVSYKEIILLVLIIFIGYKVVDDYKSILTIIDKLISIISPFIYAFVIAYILNPIVNLFEKKVNLSRGLAIGATYAVVTGIIIILSVYIIPNLVDSIYSLIKEFPTYITTIEGWINSILTNEEVKELLVQSGTLQQLTTLTTTIGNVVVSLLQNAVSYLVSLTSYVLKFILGYLIAVYVLSDKERFGGGVRTLLYIVLKEKWTDRIIEVVKVYHSMICDYIGIKMIDSAIIGLIALVGLYMMGAPYATLLALIVAVTNMVPYFGPLVGEIIGAFIGFFVSPMMGIGIFLFLLALQQFDAWYLDPKLIGKKVGVRPFYIIFGVTIGGGLFGVTGMLLGSPTIATIKVLYDRMVNKFKSENKELAKKIDR
ncbi:MAG: AI-2E family transporter [Clostridium sp.]